MKKLVFFSVFFLFGLVYTAYPQGLYTEFGENRKQFQTIEWEKLAEKQVVVFFEKGQDSLATEALKLSLIDVNNTENTFQYQLRNPLKIILYTNYSKYIEGNFGIKNHQFYAGGYSYAPQSEVFVFFDGDLQSLRSKIKKGISEVMVNEMIFGGSMVERVQTSILLVLPDWFLHGLSFYIAEGWNSKKDNLIRDAMSVKKFSSFSSLNKDESILAGQSFWFFIEKKYGVDKIKNILFHARFSRSIESALSFYTGKSLSSLFNEWQRFFLDRYAKESAFFISPKGQENKLAKQSIHTHTQLSLSEDGKRLAFVTNNRGKYKVWVYNTSQKTSKVIHSGGYKTLSREPNFGFPIVKWSSNNSIAILELNKGKLVLNEHNIRSGKIKKIQSFEGFDWVLDFVFVEELQTWVVSAVQNGFNNLYSFSTKSKSFTPLTTGKAHKSHLALGKDSSILFVGANEQNVYATQNAIFSLNVSTKESSQITPFVGNLLYANPVMLNTNTLCFLSDKNGVFNSYAITIEDRLPMLSEFKKLTNYNRNILFQDASISSSKIAELALVQNKYRVFLSNYNNANPLDEALQEDTFLTQYRKERNLVEFYTVEQNKNTVLSKYDTTNTAPNLVKVKKEAYFLSPFEQIDYSDNKKAENTLKERILDANSLSQFNVDYFLLQILDNSIISDYYFQGGVDNELFYSPIISPHARFSVSDVHRNHQIVAGARLLGTLDGSDYYFKYLYKKSAFHKNLFFNRRSRFLDYESYYERNIFTQGGLGFSYTINEKMRLESSILLRNDQQVSLSTDDFTLNKETLQNTFVGTTIAFVFDNSISKGLNLHEGLRFKIFAENYQRVNKQGNNLMAGVDLRYYKPIHRQMIFAIRGSFNSSLGSLKTAYYMGGTENWYLPKFEEGIRKLESPEYVFQTIAAPIRGFKQNVRSGNSYFAINTEIRLPLFSYLYQKPIRYDIIKSFMLVGFADLGSAWIGSNPYSPGNPYNTLYYYSPNYTLSVSANRNPFIYSYGVGARIRIAGYYLKYDLGRGFGQSVNTGSWLGHLSLGLDF
jgi:hypothetical protein